MAGMKGRALVKNSKLTIIMYTCSVSGKTFYSASMEDIITGSLKKGWLNFVKCKVNFKKAIKLIHCNTPGFNNNVSIGSARKNSIQKWKEKLTKISSFDTAVNLLECSFTVIVVNMPRGSTYSKILNLTKDRYTKKCVVSNKNKVHLCAVRAIIVGLTFYSMLYEVENLPIVK